MPSRDQPTMMVMPQIDVLACWLGKGMGCTYALTLCLNSLDHKMPHVTMRLSDQCTGMSSARMIDGCYRTRHIQDSIVLVVFDARATSVPTWLAVSGFTLWEGVEVAGAEYRFPYVYKVCVVRAFSKTCTKG